MRLALAVACLALLPGTLRADDTSLEEPSPLFLEDVLVSVEAHFPLLRVAEAERELAAGSLRSAFGAFDLRLRADADQRPEGFYDNYAGGVGFEQPTRIRGVKLFGGYRVGSGDFPSYEGGRRTNDGGEFRGGFAVPLLRGGAIDAPRAELEQARIDLRRVEPEIELQRIDFARRASVAYWTWVATGLEVGVADRLLLVAEERQEQLEGRVSRGAIPRIDLVDNERLIVDRRIRRLAAERDAKQAAVELSLFLRDDYGAPQLVSDERLPVDFPPEVPLSPSDLETDFDLAQREHPLLRRFALERERLVVDLELARNELLPSIDLDFEASGDIGRSRPGIDSEGSFTADPMDDPVVKLGVRFELPVQRREARGRVASAQAKLTRLDGRARFARESLAAEIQRAVAGLEAAYAQTLEARDNLDLALQLQRAEERKLALGSSNLINVNIRELQAADAGVALVESQANYFRALAEYRAAVGKGL